MQWWKKKHLLIREKWRIDNDFPDNDFVFERRGDDLWITGKILDFFDFECKYPQSYPSAPPEIFPKNKSSNWVPKHQYVKEGRFCLDIREKDWCSRLTAADILESLKKLLIAENIKKSTNSDKLNVYEEPEPSIVDHLLKDKIGVFPSDISIPDEIGYGCFSYVYKCNSSSYRLIITDICSGDNKQESSLANDIWQKDIPRTKFKGFWIQSNDDLFLKLLIDDDALSVIKTINSFSDGPDVINLNEIFNNQIRWVFLISTPKYPNMPFILIYNPKKHTISKHGAYVFHINQLEARIPNNAIFLFLKNRKVTVIGCGSGGSKDAEYLAKSGVGKIVLIDDDTLQTENILRHSCQLDDLSFEKVYAVKDKLTKLNPNIEVQCLIKKLNIIDTKTDELIKDSDLIIIATAANEELFNEYAYSRNIPAIYSKVYPMGFGGEIIRTIPGLTPCFECSHYYKEALLQEWKPDALFPELQSTSYDTLVDGTHIPVPALAVDSDFITLISVKMALEVLVKRDPTSLRNSPHIRLWGNKKEWVFDNDYQCISIENERVKSFPQCIVCHGDSIIETELDIDHNNIDTEYSKIFSKIKGITDNDENSNF